MADTSDDAVAPNPSRDDSVTVTIDHTAFPDLLDLVFAHCSRGTLLQFRRTSHFFRDQADKALARRLVITAGTPPTVAARDGRLPILGRRRAGKGCDSIYAGAQVVDIVGPVGSHPRSPVVSRLNSIGRVDVVRMRHPPGGRIAPTCVLRGVPAMVQFTTVTEREAVPGGVPAIADTCLIPPGTRRAVVNIRYDLNRPWLAQAVVAPLGSLPRDCTELVFILTEKATHREPQVGGGLWPAKNPCGMLWTIVQLLAATRNRDHLAVTLVDTHKLRPAWLGARDSAGPDEVDASVVMAVDQLATIQAMDATLAPPNVPLSGTSGLSGSTSRPDSLHPSRTNSIDGLWGDIAIATSTIEFMTRDEYCAAVGVPRFELETVE